jgi:DNA-binding GntR family transcriptional regulator
MLAPSRKQPLVNVSTHKFVAVYSNLRNAIETGALELGSLLPREDELCAKLNISRFTLREAMKRLEDEGFVERRRRLGTKVISRSPHRAIRLGTATAKDILQFTADTVVEYQFVGSVRANSELARSLGCDELRAWHQLAGLRSGKEDGRPVATMTLFMDADRFQIPDRLDFGGGAVYSWLEREYGVKPTSISQDISAVLLDKEKAHILGDRIGAPALRIIRRYFDENDRVFQISDSIHRSSDFVYNIHTAVS